MQPARCAPDGRMSGGGRRPGSDRRSVAGVPPGCPAGNDRAWTSARPPAWAQRHEVIDCQAGPGPASGGALPARESTHAEGKIMRVFVTGATGVLGRHLVPGLVAAGHQVTATTRTPGKMAQLRKAGAEPVLVDGLDREAVITAVVAAAPQVIVHEMTALASLRSLRNFGKEVAATNQLRTRGTGNPAAAAAAGTRRVIAQSYTGWPNERSGGPVKTEDDPLDSRAIPSTVQGLAAIRHVEEAVPAGVPEGLVLRYGGFYGPGASEPLLD